MANNTTKVAPSKVIGAVSGFMNALCEATGDRTLGAQQAQLLLALYLHGSINQTDLPRYTGVEKSANSRNIALLGQGAAVVKRSTGEKSFEDGPGLVEGYEEPLDRRYKMVRLTPKGRAVLEEAARRVAPYFS